MFDISDDDLMTLESGGRSEAPLPSSQAVPVEPLAPSPVPSQAAPISPMPVAPMPVAPGPSDAALRRGAGRALVLTGIGLVGGGLVGGAFGAAAGVVLMGALRNLNRTRTTWSHPDPAERSEAGKSATMGIFGLGVAAMLGYQAYKRQAG